MHLVFVKVCPTDGSDQLQTVLNPVSTEWDMDRRREEALMLKRTMFTRGRERCETEPGLNPDEPRGKRWKLNAPREICSEHAVCKRLKESKCTCSLFHYIILARRHICQGLLALRHLWAGSNLKSHSILSHFLRRLSLQGPITRWEAMSPSLRFLIGHRQACTSVAHSTNTGYVSSTISSLYSSGAFCVNVEIWR